MEYKVERLLVNFKTLEEFKKFKEYGIQELSMLEDLEANIIENNSQSPFFGVYFGDSLVGRMSLYKKDQIPIVILTEHKIILYFGSLKFFLVFKKRNRESISEFRKKL